MQLSELVTAVRLRANVPSTDGIWTDSYITDAINEALYLIGLEQPWPWLEVEETDSSPADPINLAGITPAVRDIRSVVIDGCFEAEPATKADIDRWDAVSFDRGRYAYTTWGDSLIVRPALAGTETVVISYYRNEPALSNDSDTPLLPAPYHPAVVHKAAAIGFEGIDDPSSAGVHEARASIMLNRMERTALRKVRRTRINVRPGSQIV